MMGGSSGMFFGGGFMWIFWLLAIAAIVIVARALLSGGKRSERSERDSPLSILEKRYAQGEIDSEEYHSKRRELERQR